ncbi:Uncharacterized protein YvpB [Bacillus sp. 71mf]|nr:Uncharacterized protein YvpB [Bacillus sp. 71mf]SFS92155.1 Uncharacterized protein YvpB [Bacillus sp. 103mf]
MSENNKLKVRSKSVAVIGVTGVCLLLAEPTFIKADNLQGEDIKSNNLQDQSQDNSFKIDNSQNLQGSNIKSDTQKDNDSKLENVQDRDVHSNNQQDSSAKSYNIESNEVKSSNPQENVSQPSTSQPSATTVQETQFIKFSQGNGIWSVPYGLQGANYVDSTNKYVGKEVQLIQKMTVNNIVWYQFSVDGQTIGWLDSRVLTDLTNVQEIDENAVMGATSNNGIWSVPYGISGANYIDLSDKYAYQNIKLIKKVTFGNATWYKFSLNGQVIGWIDDKALDKGQSTSVNFNVMIGNTNGNGIWSTPYGIMGARYLGSTNDYTYQTVQVIRTVKIGNTNWYHISKDGKLIGWIDGDRVVTDLENVQIENSTLTISGSIKPSDGIWSVPYGEYGANWIAPVSDYSYKQVQIIQSVKKWGVTWDKIKLGDRVLGWVDAKTLANLTIQNEDRTAMIGDTNGHIVWTLPYGESSAKYVNPAVKYINQPIQIIRSTEKDGVLWYNFKIGNNEEGWVDSRAISSASNIIEMNETYHVSNPEGHTVWSRPYGMQNASYIGFASNFANKNLNVKLSVNYNGVTWYAFRDNKGGLNWIDSRAVVQGSTYPHMDVPIISQRDPYMPSRNLVSGCEITSVTMMLQYAGANVDKVQLAYEMPYSSFDPNLGFVGNPFGRGWTIYPPALMDLVRKYAGSSINLTGQDIKRQLDAGKPVVVWMTMHGFTVHAITLVGYDENNFYYNDPWTGEKNASMYWSDFYNNWSTQNRRAISY